MELREVLRGGHLSLVRDDPRSAEHRPVDDLAVVARTPLAADIAVELDRVCFAVGGDCRECHVGEGDGLVDEGCWLKDRHKVSWLACET